MPILAPWTKLFIKLVISFELEIYRSKYFAEHTDLVLKHIVVCMHDIFLKMSGVGDMQKHIAECTFF